MLYYKMFVHNVYVHSMGIPTTFKFTLGFYVKIMPHNLSWFAVIETELKKIHKW